MVFQSKGLSNTGSLGSCFVCMDIGSSERLAMQNLQIADTAETRVNQSGSFHPASQTKIDLPPAVHSVNYTAKLVHTRRALSSTIINSHQETVTGQACSYLLFSFDGGVLRYPIPKWLLFLI